MKHLHDPSARPGPGMSPSPSTVPPRPERGAIRPGGADPRPAAYDAFELQFLKPCVNCGAPLVAIGAVSLMVTDKGNLLNLLHCTLVLLVASMVLVSNRNGNTSRMRLLVRVHSLFFLGFYAMVGMCSDVPRFMAHALLLGACHAIVVGKSWPAALGRLIGMVPDTPIFVLMHALLLGAFHATVGGKTWPAALGRGACVELLCIIASIALKRKCKQVYAAYLQRHDRDLEVVCGSKQGGQQAERKDWTAEGKGPASAPSLTSKNESHLASKPDIMPMMGTQSLPVGALLPHQPCQPSCSSVAGTTTTSPEGSAKPSTTVYQSRMRRRQVHIKIEAPGLEQDLRHSDFATSFSKRLQEELPGYLATELAIRVGCIIVSFDLVTSEAMPAPKPGQYPEPSSRPVDKLLPATTQSKLLSLTQSMLREYGPKRGLPHGAEISIQADGCTFLCKWDAAARLWAPDSVTAPATATSAAAKADQCNIQLCSPILQIPSFAATLPSGGEHAGLQQQSQPHAEESIPLLVAASLRGEHVGSRGVQGWCAEVHREEGNTAASSQDPKETHGINGPPLQLVARSQGRFLPVVIIHQSLVQPDEQLAQAHVLLPPSLAHASDPFALELELWAQDVCLSSQSALAVPSHLASLAREVSGWAAEVNQQDDSPSDDFVCDLADFLSFCSNREQYQQNQAEAMNAVGSDLLQFACNAKMEFLAAHLRAKIDSSQSSKGGSNEGTATAISSSTSSSISSSTSSSSRHKLGTLREGTAAAAGQLSHSFSPLAYEDFEFLFLKPCINYWALPVAAFTIAVFGTGEGGLFHFLLTALVLAIAAMMVVYNKAGNAQRVRLLFRIHSACWLGYYVMWIVGAATAQPVMLFGDFSLHLFCAPFYLMIGMGCNVPRYVPAAHVLAHALLLGAFHAIVGRKTWPAALGRGACVQLLCIIATIVLKRKCKQVYAAYLQRHDRDLAVACSNKQG